MLKVIDAIIAIIDTRTPTTKTTTKITRGNAAAHLVDQYGLKTAVAILLSANNIK